MNTSIVEIVKWKSAPGVTDPTMIEAALGLAPDLYKNGDEWVDIHDWKTVEDAHLSNEQMAQKESLSRLFSLVQPVSVSIAVMSKA